MRYSVILSIIPTIIGDLKGYKPLQNKPISEIISYSFIGGTCHHCGSTIILRNYNIYDDYIPSYSYTTSRTSSDNFEESRKNYIYTRNCGECAHTISASSEELKNVSRTPTHHFGATIDEIEYATECALNFLNRKPNVMDILDIKERCYKDAVKRIGEESAKYILKSKAKLKL